MQSPATTADTSNTSPASASGQASEQGDQLRLVNTADSTNTSSHRIRYRKLKAILDKSLTSVIESFRAEDVHAALPQLSKDIPQVLDDTHRQLCSYICNSAQDDFSSIILQYDIKNKFDQLDDFIADAKARHQSSNNAPTNRGLPLDPGRAVRARVMSIKNAEIERLSKLVEEMEAENQRLLASLEQRSLQIDAEREQLGGVYRILKKTSQVALDQ